MKINRKFKFIVLLVFVFIISQLQIVPSYAKGYSKTKGNIKLDLCQSIKENKEKFKVNEEFTINYTIDPEDILKQNIVKESRKKEIVMVIDTSGSMGWNLEGNKCSNKEASRLGIVKKAANRFIDEFKNSNEDVKISLIEYASSAYIKSDLVDKSKFDSLKKKINKFQAGGGTNIGDGLRKAYYKLKNSSTKDAKKYIVLMTDGEATGYSYVYKNGIFEYLQENRKSYYYNDKDDLKRGYQYAKLICNDIFLDSSVNIDNFMIGFTKDSNRDKLKELANISDGTYREALNENDIDYVYNQIAESIKSDFSVNNVKFELNLPKGIKAVKVPENFQIKDQKVIGDLGSINYNFNSNKDKYISSSKKEFSISLKGAKEGKHDLKNTAFITYKDIDESAAKNFFSQSIKLNIGNSNNDNLINLELCQSIGENKQDYITNEEFMINYTINPMDVLRKNIDNSSNSKDKEIVMVIDTSGSMGWDLDGKEYSREPSRLNIVKKAANRFIDKFKDSDENVKISLIEYASKAYVKSDLVGKNGFGSLEKEINNFMAGGGTNIGDGLRKAYYKLKDSSNKEAKKYIVLMTDGEATAYSCIRNDKGYVYLQDDRDKNYYYNRYDNDFARGQKYAELISEMIASDTSIDINNFMIGFTKDSDVNKLKKIANICNGTYMKALNEKDIDNVYNQIAETIKADFSINNVKFELNLPKGIECVKSKLPENFEVNGQKVIGNLGSINYNLNSNEDKYISSSKKQFSISLKGTKEGSYDLKNTAFITYKDIDESEANKFFSQEIKLNIEAPYNNNILIIKQGIFVNKKNAKDTEEYITREKNNTIDIVDKYSSKLGILFNMNSNGKINLNVSVNKDSNKNVQIGLDENKIDLYKVDKNKKLILENQPIISKINDNIINIQSKNILSQGQYILIYEMTPNLNSNSINNLQIINEASFDKIKDSLKVNICKLPDLD
ncbi:VWA domain-containing protein [Haloimpatiens sp. FM7330]|uniref:VWA domain-containing protein n=1 Tax=Haloimpatiens sp. FM7330 TaxID=3298610 RepID=UPI00362D7625